MKRTKKTNPALIRKFILQNIEKYPTNIASLTARHFDFTRVTANRYLDKLVDEGALDAAGATRARAYALKTLKEVNFEFEVKGLQEDVVWRNCIAPLLHNEAQNVISICQHGVTEMVNNVIDHSNSSICRIHFRKTAAHIQIVIEDLGIGIFKKIADKCHLNDQREAILELTKGKLTTDPDKHSGEGIFFTSRMFTEFSLYAGQLILTHEMHEEDDWLIETKERVEQGTIVFLKLSPFVTYEVQDIFKKYESDNEGVKDFSKTHVPVRLSLYTNEQLVSRSQARRVLSRFNKFSEIILDFKDVATIGQAFADEIFRVFKKASIPLTHV